MGRGSQWTQPPKLTVWEHLMNEYLFRAIAAHSGQPMSVEVFMADGSHGFTPRDGGELQLTGVSAVPQRWYAMARGRRVATGTTSGGAITIAMHADRAEVLDQPAPLAKAG